MINWTKDERTAALLLQARAHFDEYNELSLEVEAKLELIREEYLRDLWNDFRGEDTDGFEALIGANKGCYHAFAAVYECEVPVVAAVAGFCVGWPVRFVLAYSVVAVCLVNFLITARAIRSSAAAS